MAKHPIKPVQPNGVAEALAGSPGSRMEPHTLSIISHQSVPARSGDTTCCCSLQTKATTIQDNASNPSPDRTTQLGHDVAYVDLDEYLIGSNRERKRKRDRVKEFVIEKGPRIVGAAAAIGLFVFNIVSNCC